MILFAAAGCMTAATNDDGQKGTTAPAAERATSLPKDATKNQDGTYSWIDKEGKQWMYRKTAAGYVRSLTGAVQRAPLTIPKDAVANPDGSYIWTDKAGQKWAFRNSPFGVMKTPWTAPAPSGAEPVDTVTKVIDKGDTVRFERPSPFGVTGYEKKKSELNEDERRLYEASKAKPE